MQYFDCDKIQYEGPSTKNPLAFKHYNPDELVDGKPMKDHLRFAAPYWHVMRNVLGDPFGAGTAQMPWDDGSNSVDNALKRVDVFFEFLPLAGGQTDIFGADTLFEDALAHYFLEHVVEGFAKQMGAPLIFLHIGSQNRSDFLLNDVHRLETLTLEQGPLQQFL